MNGYLRGEDREAFVTRQKAQDQTGLALAQARADRGQWLTSAERTALNRISRFGSDSYDIRRVGNKWQYASPATITAPLYRTRTEAWCAWETLVASWIALSGLERRRDEAADEQRIGFAR